MNKYLLYSSNIQITISLYLLHVEIMVRDGSSIASIMLVSSLFSNIWTLFNCRMNTTYIHCP